MNNRANSLTNKAWGTAASTGTDLHLDFVADGPSRGRGARQRRDLAESLRAAITDGRLTAGSRLPPYRSLAADLGIARGTAAAAYSDLIAEGWLVARQGAGTRVAERVTATPPMPAARSSATATPPRHNFLTGQPNAGRFPRADWITATRHALGTAPDSAFDPCPPHGSWELRTALAHYLARARGVLAEADQIVLTPAVQYSLRLLTPAVLGRSVAVESHGLMFHREAIEERGAATIPVPLDDHGAVIDAIPPRATSVLLTPSHQSPTGVSLSPARRTAVIDWARRTSGLVVEDDYDGEYRYARDRVGALQALGPDVVAYTGSVSKTLSPSVRIGWLVLPHRLVEQVAWSKGLREPDASIVDQLVLAEMINSGAYDRHIRRTRQFYRRRRDQLIAALAEIGINVSGIAGGLHAVIATTADRESALIRAAIERDIGVTALSFFAHPAATDPPRHGLVVGFGTPSASSYTTDVAALTSLLRDIA
ncbi:putative GntR family transcriptional regulator [Gordonia araii NBRC 100433]|uniref:Putative GntR family transcriptional regulator n=1 Tax=Gordonia araii NBRC 100433 TaxID=1073574 RepID=G7GZ48_9ACTN|nr:PLP-dependent aminotransferase family protein [Gordonia araii]NNG97080.1 PLP-dependent aminotransferase family protein [Gordonia araii NBRC 100433]GAB08873.1 putative GntR family transcriptional regulator [Gordonia araii NBRC 100433]